MFSNILIGANKIIKSLIKFQAKRHREGYHAFHSFGIGRIGTPCTKNDFTETRDARLTMIKLYMVVLARNTGTVLVAASSSAELTGTDLKRKTYYKL